MILRRGGPLALGAGVVGLGLFFLLGAQRVAGEAQYAGVGPRAFPVLVGAALVCLGLALCVGIVRGMEFKAEGGEDVDTTLAADLGVVTWIAGGLALGILLLSFVGFPLVAALLFAWTARGFGSRTLLRDALLGLLLGLLIFFLFARALGVSLPGGPLG